MNENQNQITKIPTDRLPTQLTLMVRLLVGGYLLYTDYGLIGSLTKPETTPQEKVFFGVAMLVFLIVGAVLVFLSVKYYKEGRYQGGAMDAGEDCLENKNQEGIVLDTETDEDKIQEVVVKRESDN